jgi:hypothetical protein
MAMGSRIDPHLELSADGKTIKVTGPTGKWEDRYLLGATFRVVVAQVQQGDEHKIVLAKGESDREFTRDDDWWYAEATVCDPPGAIFELGPASAWGIASIRAKDGAFEPFQWGVETRLVKPADPE